VDDTVLGALAAAHRYQQFVGDIADLLSKEELAGRYRKHKREK
jgi:hypothetical protein